MHLQFTWESAVSEYVGSDRQSSWCWSPIGKQCCLYMLFAFHIVYMAWTSHLLLATQVVLVEEAAEVMEVHTLAALAPSTEHVILIGDHEQLRPKAQLWEMQVENLT